MREVLAALATVLLGVLVIVFGWMYGPFAILGGVLWWKRRKDNR